MLDLDIQQICLKQNCGPGVARQTGLDAATGKYIMFCDADDTLHNVGIIEAMIMTMEDKDLDIIQTSWIEEFFNIDTNQMIYVNHFSENTWLHGKMFKREFLKQNNISFHPDLRIHEDTYFLNVACIYTDKMYFLDAFSYVWKWSEKSITRKDNGIYRYSGYAEFIRACSLANEIRKTKRPEQMEYMVVQTSIYSYFLLHSIDWLDPKYKEYLKTSEEAFVKYMTPFWDYWKNASPSFIATIYNEERQKAYQTQIEYETLSQWLSRLGLPDASNDISKERVL